MSLIILTADRALFTDFSGADFLGFGLCLPYRLVPAPVEYNILAPRMPVDESGRALCAPYALAKVEASLLTSGFKRDDVVITPPEYINRTINNDTRIVAIHVVDPLGLAPVSWTLKSLTGGGESCTEYEFRKLMAKIARLKKKFKFKVVVGGPGSWQLRGHEDEFLIDVLFEGEAELTFPVIAKRIIDGDYVPRRIRGEAAPIDGIPVITTPARSGMVQITRGCPRRCRFCNPTMFKFRSIPLDAIVKEAVFNVKHGAKTISFITEDVLLYGAKGVMPNVEAVKRLFGEVKNRTGVTPSFCHVTPSTALAAKEAVRYITELCDLNEDRPIHPQVGLESGSPRIVEKYFSGKPYPWKPSEWPMIVLEASGLFNENYWYPCYTYIIGFPGAKPSDYVKTTELIDDLHYMRFKGWIFPLLLIPMGGSLLDGKVKFSSIKELPGEAFEASIAGWKHSLWFSKLIYPKLISTIKNTITRRIAELMTSIAITAMENWINSIEKDPSVIEKIYAKVNIRSMPGFLAVLMRGLRPKVLVRRSQS